MYFPKALMMHRPIHILCRAWHLCCVSPLLLSCLRASWLRLATSQAANSLRTIAFQGFDHNYSIFVDSSGHDDNKKSL